MVTALVIVLSIAAAWIAPKAFSWLLLGPTIGAPLGFLVWTIAVQWMDWLFTLRAAGLFALVGSLLVGFAFARGK